MKKLTLFSALLLCSVMLMAQQKTEVYTFTVVKENPITSVKNQNSTGTCWCFSGLGFLAIGWRQAC